MSEGIAVEGRLSEEEVLQIFRRTGVLLEGHFRLTSGRHSGRYLQCAQVLQYPEYANALCREIARHHMGQKVEAVIGPALGGVIIAYEVARALGARALFAEREGGVMTLRRGFTLNPGERVLVVEDVITTGGSVREVLDIVITAGATPAGVGVLVDRSAGTVDFGLPLKALVSLNVESYPPEDCPICREGRLPLVKPGSRAIS